VKTELIEYHRHEVLIYKNVFGQAQAGSRPCAEAAVLKDFHERAVAWLESQQASTERTETALRELLEMYVQLANSGDCGNWNPEEEDEVIAARAALTTTKPPA